MADARALRNLARLVAVMGGVALTAGTTMLLRPASALADAPVTGPGLAGAGFATLVLGLVLLAAGSRPHAHRATTPAEKRATRNGALVAALTLVVVAGLGMAVIAPAGLLAGNPEEASGPAAAGARGAEPVREEPFEGSVSANVAPLAGALPGGSPRAMHEIAVPDSTDALLVTLNATGAAVALVVEIERNGTWERVASASGAASLQAAAEGLDPGFTNVRVTVELDGGTGPVRADYEGVLHAYSSGLPG